MQRTYRVPLTRAGLMALSAIALLLAHPGTSIAGGKSESTRGAATLGGTPLQLGAGYGAAGASGRVRALQRELRSLGWRPGPVDGLFGPRTQSAVMRFQQAAGLDADGIVGPRTRHAFRVARKHVLRRGAGYAQAGGSPQVRRLQRELKRRGLRPGPVDGRFGPRTEAAVARLQRAVRLPADGVVDRPTRRVLARVGSPDHTPAKSTPRAESLTRTLSSAPVRAPKSDKTPKPDTTATVAIPLAGGAVLAALLLGALLAWMFGRGGVVAGMSIPLAHGVVAEGRSAARSIGRFRGQVHALVLGRRGVTRRQDARYLISTTATATPFWVSHDEVTKLVASQPERAAAIPRREPVAEGVRALGYASVPHADHRDDESLRKQAGRIDALCEERGWRLVGTVRDVEGESGKGLERPGLQYALEQIAKGEASYIVVSDLGRLTRSAADLGQILQRLKGHGGRLVALDVGLDTGSTEGEIAAQALMSVGVWERRRLGERTRKGLAAARAKGAGTGRPAVSDVPALAERIVRMRSGGMTLQAIADQLNEEGVPTLRGGKKWRPSSVQATAGYRRPSRSQARARPEDEP
jgi:peptidoglycan hydrolase-like protein with peptidoglycan-binding domain/DNA invertase Pin-like site-specific DNA recombinase